ncbi:Hypothetical protein PHPALM_19901 [Phytophthora palmivora]|uniref:Uncharacterized protein n=1 Tax=Phytophthora palmivora TaxID=4796 RepID=A0A2P4XG71_9STRA|nr:Hypothetical protein PHPALM_19901 [Phytophthora palmivora]
MCANQGREIKRYRVEVSRLREERDTLRASLESDHVTSVEPPSAAPEILTLEAQVVDLNRDLDHRLDEIRHLQAHIDDLSQDRGKLESTIHHLASEMAQADGETLDLQQANPISQQIRFALSVAASEEKIRPLKADAESMDEEDESEFDLGGGSTGGRSPSPDQASTPPSKDVDSSQLSGEVIEVGSGSDGEEEVEEEDNAEVADDLYEAQTLMTISQSRSEARRRDHASPQRRPSGGFGGSPGGSDGSNSDAGSGDQGNGSGPTGESAAVDIDPWIESRLANQTLIVMTVTFLYRFCGHLITEANIKALQAPWQVIRNTLPPISFEDDVGGRLGIFLRQYRDFEASELIAYWESTHKFPITAAMIAQSPWLGSFAKQRNNRRSHAGNRWKRMLLTLIQAMIEGWCDLDLLLDPFFLHFPKRTDEVASYPGIEARRANLADPQLNRREPTDLLEADTADPWRNHYRDHTADYCVRHLPRLGRKFFGLQVALPPPSS